MTLQQAAQALMGAVKIDRHDTEDWPETSRKAFDELRKALADEQAQEPVSANHRTTGWVAPVDRYAVPVLFNPYTGEPRDVRDVQSDPQGVLIVPPGKAEMLAAKPTVESVTDCMMNLVDRLGHEASDVDARAWEHLLVYAPKQAQAVEPVGYIRHSDKTFWLHPECAVYASLSPSLVPVYVSPTPTFTETLAAQGIKLRKEFESKPRDHVEADRNMVGERAELIQWLRRAHEVSGNKNSKTIADMLEADAQEIEGWKADQKENLGNQVELQGRINDLKAHQVAAPASLAAWLQWCLDNCDDSPEYNFGTTATEHMRALLAGFPAQMPPSQNRSKAMTLYGWMIEGSPAVMRGEFAELDAKAEAARIGGTCKAFAVYRDMPLVAKQDSPQKTDWSAA